jgi:hypothetical protein
MPALDKGKFPTLSTPIPPDVADALREAARVWARDRMSGTLSTNALRSLPKRAVQAIVEAALRDYLEMD